MSISIIVLKKIGGFSYEKTLHSVQQAAALANMYCLHLETLHWVDPISQEETEYLEGVLSEVSAEMLKANFKKGIHTRSCGFTIQKPTAESYDSFSWLVHEKDYFWALDLQYLEGDFAFAFQFLAQYFKLEENIHDYLWVDDTDWVYSADEMIWLSSQAYRPEWTYKKLTSG